MADSDNSRTLSTVTRADFHSFVAASLPTSQELARATPLPSDACNDDPALAVCQDHTAQALWRTPARSVAGATAKLHALGTNWQPSSTSEEEPWPQNPLRHRRPPEDRHRLCCEPPVYARTPIRASRRLDGNGSPGHVIPGAPPT